MQATQPRRSSWSVVLAALACLQGCAQPTPPPAAAVPQARISYGTIVSVRSIPSADPHVPQADIIDAVGGPSDAPHPTAPIAEFIVREDNVANPISVVQGNASQLHAGERVVLRRDGRTQIARLAQ